MELQIQDLVASIRKEGIDKANAEAKKIISDAQAKADEIVAKAKADSQALLDETNKEIAVLKESARIGAKQAQRDAALSFRKEVEEQVKKILTADVKNALDSEALVKLIQAAVADQDVSKLTVEVNNVSEALKAQLAKEIKAGLELKPVKDISAGFRVCAKDGSGFFDCTDEEVAQMLAPFVGELNI